MSPTNRKRTDGQNEKGQSKPPDSRKQYPEPEPDPEPFPQAAGDIATSTRLNIADGIVVISGDWHCYVSEWSRKRPTAYRALLKFLYRPCPSHQGHGRQRGFSQCRSDPQAPSMWMGSSR